MLPRKIFGFVCSGEAKLRDKAKAIIRAFGSNTGYPDALLCLYSICPVNCIGILWYTFSLSIIYSSFIVVIFIMLCTNFPTKACNMKVST
jgi:hypothetical protein